MIRCRNILILVLSIQSVQLIAQIPKYDYTWVFGQHYEYVDSISGQILGGSILHFGDSIEKHHLDIDMTFVEQNTSMSDLEGQLLYYSNGCEIFDAKHRLIPGTDTLTEGEWAIEEWCYRGDGYPTESPPIVQGMISLPHPEDPDRFYIIYADMDSLFDSNGYLYFSWPFVWLVELEKITDDGEMRLLRKIKLLEGSHWDHWSLAAVKQKKAGALVDCDQQPTCGSFGFD